MASAGMDNLRSLCRKILGAASRSYSAFGVPFRLQQDLFNEANVAGHGTS